MDVVNTEKLQNIISNHRKAKESLHIAWLDIDKCVRISPPWSYENLPTKIQSPGNGNKLDDGVL